MTRTQTSLEIPYNSFTQNTRLIGHAIHRIYTSSKPINHLKPKGRPLGSKDKHKRHSKHHPRPPTPKSPPQKRGRKKIRTHGHDFQFHPGPLPTGWQLEWGSPNLQAVLGSRPPLSELELILDVTYKIMNGKTIQSNRIESRNRMIKDVTPRRGLKNPTHLIQQVTSHLRYWGDTTPEFQLKPPRKLPLKASTGFARIFTFFHPRIEAIQILGGN